MRFIYNRTIGFLRALKHFGVMDIHKRLKKIGCIAFISIFLMQSGAVLLIYMMEQTYVQSEMLEKIKSSQTEFQKLTLTVTEFHKCKINAHELSCNGKMYDYESAVVVGSTVELLVINDISEENILEKIRAFTNNPSHQNNQLPNQIIKLLTLTYLCPTANNKFFFPELQQNIFLSICENIVSFSSKILSPPPELA